MHYNSLKYGTLTYVTLQNVTATLQYHSLKPRHVTTIDNTDTVYRIENIVADSRDLYTPITLKLQMLQLHIAQKFTITNS
jgi:hypothetical protein